MPANVNAPQGLKDRLFDLTGKIVFLSGGTGVLGWTYAQALSEAGAKLVLTDMPDREPDRKAKELSARFGSEVLGLSCDVNEEAQVVDAFAKSVKHFGKIDVVINNAAGTGEFLMSKGDVFSDFENYPLSVWNAVLQTNLTGTFLVAREGGRAMRSSGGGSIINVASTYGLVGPDHRIYEGMPFKSFPGYSASKAGVVGLTRWLATYWGDKGIRVNVVVPGGVYNGHKPEFVERYAQRTPMGRMADREDLVGIVVYLASDASKYCTGQSYIVDGGFTAW